MNLKESFRYQNFLENMLAYAGNSLTDREHSLTITKNHLRKKANAEAEDMMETVDVGEFFKNDDVLKFMTMLVEERSKLTKPSARRKRQLGLTWMPPLKQISFVRLLQIG